MKGFVPGESRAPRYLYCPSCGLVISRFAEDRVKSVEEHAIGGVVT